MRTLAFVALALFLCALNARAGAMEDAAAAYARGEYAKAIDLWRPLAEQGDAHAQYELGVMYEKGQGVTKDYAEAVKWYRLAAEQGLATARYGLGGMYENGWGVASDAAEGLRWYRMAADQGLAAAQKRLGDIYFFGGGHTYFTPGPRSDYAEAESWYRKAADQGDADAEISLGGMYLFGKSTHGQSFAEAAVWYLAAASQGAPTAQLMIGRLHHAGKGVPQDDVQALKWLSLAAVQRAQDGEISDAKELQRTAVSERDALASQMSPAEVAEAERLVREWKPVTVAR